MSATWREGLRDYQLRMICEARDLWRSGKRRIGVFSATGTGKTRVMGGFARMWVGAGYRVLVLEDRIEMIDQTVQAFAAVGLEAGAVQGQRGQWQQKLLVATAQTISRRKDELVAWVGDGPALLMVDEDHDTGWTAAAGWLYELWQRLAMGVVLHITATPFRLSPTEGYDKQCDAFVAGMTTAQAQAHGWLVQDRYELVDCDLSGVKLAKTGEYELEQQEVALAQVTPIQAVVQAWRRVAADRLTLVFAVSVRHAQALAAAFGGLAIWGDMPTAEREAALAAFRAGRCRVLCNVGIAIKGLDIPAIGCVVLAMMTESRAAHLQRIGRGLRLAPGKQDCIIIDQGGNVGRHGRACDLAEYTLTRSRKKGDMPGAAEAADMPMRDRPCEFCGSVVPARVRACWRCGNWVPPAWEKIVVWPAGLEGARFGVEQRRNGFLKVLARGDSFKNVPARIVAVRELRNGRHALRAIVRHPAVQTPFYLRWLGQPLEKGAQVTISGEIQRYEYSAWCCIGVEVRS